MKTIQGVVNWGIIGCGDVCEVKSGPAFSKANHSKLVAVMRRDRIKAEDYARRHQVELFFDDAEELIQDKRVNAIYIATPPLYHEEFTILSLAAGKPVYVEKPVSIDTASVERMISLSKKYQVPVTVAHYRRALPLFKEVKACVEKGTLGQIQLILIKTLQPAATDLITKTVDNWRVNPRVSGGGLFHDLSPHQLDILTWIFGKPEVIRGHSMNQLNQYKAPDVTSLELVFPGNILLQGIWAFNMPAAVQEDQCTIIGTEGSLSFSFFRNPGMEWKLTKNNGDSASKTFEVPAHIQQPMIEKVVSYFRGEMANPCSLEEAEISMEIMDATLGVSS